MKRPLFLSITLTMLILTYGCFAQFLPLRDEIISMQRQGQTLALQINKIKSTRSQDPGLGNDAFYAWLDEQHLPSIHLLAISGNSQNIHVEWEGEALNTLQLLGLLRRSRFSHFELHEIGNTFNTIIDFTVLLPIENEAKAPQVIPKMNPIESKISKVLGVVKKEGKVFCVIESHGKVLLQEGLAC